ncbi:hypothetical protein AAC387_Pa01g2777 [Persea americana]
MDKKRQILELRKKLEKTLASPALSNDESITSLVKSQLLRSSSCETEGDIGDVIQRRTKEVSNFLEILRSASGNDCDTVKTNGMLHKDWKLKQDNDQIRVMYREGPQGTPFHTLLAEGYVDGPIDVCLCLSWETTLYRKWWPQFNIPPFKIIMSKCLQKVRIGEEISLVRVKVPWPVSAREALLHYFELEYVEDDLIIVLINTVSDTEDIDVRTHGFSRDVIPEANDMVRVGLVGGFALQKVNSNKSYFRTIANLDIKLDFVPPALINFVSRQLIGSGFKLYQKTVASVTNGDEDFSKILEEGPMYIRIRKGLKSYDEDKDSEPVSPKNSVGILAERSVKSTHAHIPAIEHKLVSEIKEDEAHPIIPLEGAIHVQIQDGLKSYDSHKGQEAADKVKSASIFIRERETAQAHIPIVDQTSTSEIQECETSTTLKVKENQYLDDDSPTHLIDEQCIVSKGSSFISPEVELALGILDKALALVRGHGYSDDRKKSSPDDDKLLNLGIVAKSSLASSQAGRVSSRMGCMDTPSVEVNDSSVVHDIRSDVDNGSDDDKKASASGNGNDPTPRKIQEGVLSSSPDGIIHANIVEAPLPQMMMNGVDISVVKDNGAHENGNGSIVSDSREKPKKKRHHGLCC